MKNRKKLLNIHVPKTGGTTLLGILNNNYNTKLADIYDFSKKSNELISEDYDCLSGHLPYSIKYILPEDINIICFLRNPISRIKSIYDWIINYTSCTMEELTYDFIKDHMLCDLSTKNNGIIRQILGLNNTSLSNVIIDKNNGMTLLENCKYILNSIDFVGFTEEYDISLNILKEMGILTNIDYTIRNSSNTKNIFTQDIYDLISEYNELDIMLYEYFYEDFKKKYL